MSIFIIAKNYSKLDNQWISWIYKRRNSLEYIKAGNDSKLDNPKNWTSVFGESRFWFKYVIYYAQYCSSPVESNIQIE